MGSNGGELAVKYRIWRSEKDKLDYRVVADGVVSKEFKDFNVKEGRVYNYKVEVIRDDGKFYDRDSISVKAKGEEENVIDPPPGELPPLDCNKYEFTENYTAFSSLLTVEQINALDQEGAETGDDTWYRYNVPGAAPDQEYNLVATEVLQVENENVQDAVGFEEVTVYVYEGDFSWNNDEEHQMPWLHDVFQFKGGVPETFYRLFSNAYFAPLKCATEQLRDNVGLIKHPNLEGAFEYANMMTGALPAFVGDAAPVGSLSNMLSGQVRWNHPLVIDTSEVTSFSHMFYDNIQFNQELNFNTEKVTSMHGMFMGARMFDSPLNFTDTSKVEKFSGMFMHAIKFNQPLNFDFSSAANLRDMFSETLRFNQPIPSIGDNVTNLSGMFEQALSFDQDISGWNTENVEQMRGTFSSALSFNQDIGGWNTGNVEYMDYMFNNAVSFDQDISGWDTSSLDCGLDWDTGEGRERPDMFDEGAGFEGQYEKQPSFKICEVPSKHRFVVDPLKTDFNWSYLPTSDADNGSLEQVGTETISYPDPAWINENIGDLPSMDFDEFKEWLDAGGWDDWTDQAPVLTAECPVYEADFNWDNGNKQVELTWLLDILAFKDNQISSGHCAFIFSPARHFTALPTLDTSNLDSMWGMFAYSILFNQSLDNFDTSNVWNMQAMFAYCLAFNQPLSHFEMGNVQNTFMMFAANLIFDQNINNWDVAGITKSAGMFAGAYGFNSPLDQWNVSNWRYGSGSSDDGNFYGFLLYGAHFDQDLSSWCVENAGTTRPALFCLGSPIYNDDAKQPKWGQPC